MMEGACFGENEGCCGPGSMHHGPGPMGHGQVSMVHGQVSEARKLKGACSGRGLIWKGFVLEGGSSKKGFWEGVIKKWRK